MTNLCHACGGVLPQHTPVCSLVAAGEPIPFTKPREDMYWVDATPDEEYPVRILEAHLRGNTETYSYGSGEGAEALAEIMNSASEERAALLRVAIEAIREKRAAMAEALLEAQKRPRNGARPCYTCGRVGCVPWSHSFWTPEDEER